MDLELQPDLEDINGGRAGSVQLSYASASRVVSVSLYLETRPATAPAATTCSRDP